MTTHFGQAIQRYLRSLGVSEAFLENLMEEANGQFDDWALVVKLHALLESALVERMQAHLGVGNASDKFVASLDMRRRAAYLRLFDKVTDADVKFIEGLGDLRGAFVHAARNTERVLLTDKFTANARFQSAESNLRAACLAVFGPTGVGAKVYAPADYWKTFPEWAIFAYVRHLMGRFAYAAGFGSSPPEGDAAAGRMPDG